MPGQDGDLPATTTTDDWKTRLRENAPWFDLHSKNPPDLVPRWVDPYRAEVVSCRTET